MYYNSEFNVCKSFKAPIIGLCMYSAAMILVTCSIYGSTLSRSNVAKKSHQYVGPVGYTYDDAKGKFISDMAIESETHIVVPEGHIYDPITRRTIKYSDTIEQSGKVKYKKRNPLMQSI